MNRIRSSRRLEVESKRNLELLWLIRRLAPDFKTIADFRRDNPIALKNVFRNFVKTCMKLGLYGKELAAIDGSKFKAVNSKDRNFTRDKLKDRVKRIEEKIEKYMEELDEGDAEEAKEKKKSAEEIRRIIEELKERKGQYQGYAEEMEKAGETQKSLTDGDSRLMLANGKMDICYNVQTAVDSKNKMIAEFEVTNNANDMNQITPMMEKVKEILGTETIAVAADAGYASASDIAAAVQLGVEVHVAGTDYDICVPAKEGEGETEISSHNNGRCVYVKDRNIAICPMGEVLYPKHYNKEKGEAVFYNSKVCRTCTCRCTKESRGFRYRFVMDEGDFKTDYNDKELAVKQVHIKPKKEIYDQRKSLSEHPYGTIKRSMDAGYCLMKGKQKVGGEFSLIFLAYNLKRAISILGTKKMLKSIAL